MRLPFAGRPLATITEDDLDQLVANRVPESDFLDFKREPGFEADAGKREFVKDVVAFANSGGGVLVYGIDEERVDGKPSGVPASFSGFDVPNEDALIRQCRSMLDDGVDERIAGVEIRAVFKAADGKAALIVRVPRSLQAPHQVIRDKDFRFYGRNGAQRSVLTRSQVRDIVLRNADRYEAIRRQHAARVSAYRDRCSDPFWMFHVVPLVAQPDAFDLTDRNVFEPLRTTLTPPMSDALPGWNWYHCLDGFKVEGPVRAANYSLLMRDGSFEFVEKVALDAEELYSGQIEKEVFASFSKAATHYGEGRLSLPFVVCLTLRGLEGKRLAIPTGFYERSPKRFPINEITFDPILVSTLNEKPWDLMKPWIDLIWQAAGWPRPLTYNDDGTWKRTPNS